MAVPAVALRVGWGEWWGSNPRQPEPQSGALPTELHPPFQLVLSIRFLR